MSDMRAGAAERTFLQVPAPTHVEALRAARALACTAAFTLACAIHIAVRYAALGGRAVPGVPKRF